MHLPRASHAWSTKLLSVTVITAVNRKRAVDAANLDIRKVFNATCHSSRSTELLRYGVDSKAHGKLTGLLDSGTSTGTNIS